MGHPSRSLDQSRLWRARKLQKGAILAARLETFVVTFWKGLWLLSAHVLCTYLVLKLKVIL